MYITTITKSGQITLSKALRDALGVKNGEQVTLDYRNGKVVIERRLSDDEFFARLDAIHQKYSGTPVPKIDPAQAVRDYREGKNPEITKSYRKKFIKEAA